MAFSAAEHPSNINANLRITIRFIIISNEREKDFAKHSRMILEAFEKLLPEKSSFER